jgi:hypothetical protein
MTAPKNGAGTGNGPAPSSAPKNAGTDKAATEKGAA